MRFSLLGRVVAAGAFASATVVATPFAALHAQPGALVIAERPNNQDPIVPSFTGAAVTWSSTVREGFGNQLDVIGAQLLTWNPAEYSGGGPTAYSSSAMANSVGEFSLFAPVGQTVSLTSARFGGYFNAERFVRVQVYDASWTSLFDQIVATATSPQVLVDFGAGVSSEALRMQWSEVNAAGVGDGLLGGFNVGFSTIDYAVSERTIVPEPSSAALLALGIVGLGGVARQRRRVA